MEHQIFPRMLEAAAKCILVRILKIRVTGPTSIRVFCASEDIKDGLFFLSKVLSPFLSGRPARRETARLFSN